MSEKTMPKRGDRVRVVIEGEVTEVNGGDFEIGTCMFWHKSQWITSLEILPPPLPEAVGSVVRASEVERPHSEVCTWVRAVEPGAGIFWRCAHGWKVDDNGLVDPVVIFDAGGES